MKTDLLQVSYPLLSACLNGAYQGILITILVAIGLRLARWTNAATRHAILLAMLMVVALLIPAHYWWDRHEAATAEAEIVEAPPLARPVKQLDELPPAPSLSTSEKFSSPPAVLPQTESGSSIIAPPELREISGASTPPLIKRLVSRLDRVKFTIPRQTPLVVLSLWAGAALIRLVLLFCRLCTVRRFKKYSLPPSGDLLERFQTVASHLGVNRCVSLRLSPAHASPIVAGFVRPVILLPSAEVLSLSCRETEAVLRHELAHVRRYDDWTNLLQHIVQALFFFHPAVWWISKRLSLEREIASDDFVLEHGGVPRAYALTLADLAQRLSQTSSVLSPGISTSKSQLQQRIAMILNTQRNTSARLAGTRFGFITSVSAIIAALTLASAPRLVLAQEPAPAKGEQTPQSLPGQAQSEPKAATTSDQATSDSSKDNSSLEERLNRLEKIVQKLVARESADQATSDEHGWDESKGEPRANLKIRAFKLAEAQAKQAEAEVNQAQDRMRKQVMAASKEEFGDQLDALIQQREQLASELKQLDAEIHQLKDRQLLNDMRSGAPSAAEK